MTTLDEVAFTVEAGKVGEFVAATRTTDPVHVDPNAARAAGFPAPPATATHVMVCGHHRDQQAMLDRLGLARERVVVGSVRWRYHRALMVGDELRGVRHVTGDTTRTSSAGAPLRVVTLATVFVDQAGEPAVTLTETVLEKGA